MAKKLNAPTMAMARAITAKRLVLLSGSSMPSTAARLEKTVWRVTARRWRRSQRHKRLALLGAFTVHNNLTTAEWLVLLGCSCSVGAARHPSVVFASLGSSMNASLSTAQVAPLPTKNFNNDDRKCHEREMPGNLRRTGL
uniref:Uncharacterized protein n=1 Tax=Oryza meridionalis TaxID=40149 RepID=A0A0E0DNE0_9ORYZ